jgi:UDP-N-acetylenolpyruvoylglucosamine reductase
MHANWIVNPTKKGSAQDVFTLIELAQNTVLTQCKVKLVPEVKLWGFSDVKGVVSNN